ncbi:MAG TPA: hypothetical protein VN783_00970 [Thermoanaerobaculia bacterium]|nr:hypothetical protein [Thermoanaerobaculia bacterium]
MAAHAVTLRLPPSLYDLFSSRAERAQRSLEAELLEAVATVAAGEEELSLDVAEAVAALELLSDEELWRAARNPPSEADRSQLEALNLKQQKQKLTPAERETLERLVQEFDRAVLLRAEAARLLKERGQDVSSLLTAR